MPRRNRVNPFGEIVSVPDRGLFMGNRGRLHRPDGTLSRSFAGRHWIICQLQYKDEKRAVMTRGYTELFFLDEATALAAGHRPCQRCWPAAYKAFRQAWLAANPDLPGLPLRDAMDDPLHAERTAGALRRAALGELPDGAFVVRSRDDRTAWLLWQGRLHRWTPGGYSGVAAADVGEMVQVLTPASTVAVLRAGYRPVVHPSVGGVG